MGESRSGERYNKSVMLSWVNGLIKHSKCTLRQCPNANAPTVHECIEWWRPVAWIARQLHHSVGDTNNNINNTNWISIIIPATCNRHGPITFNLILAYCKQVHFNNVEMFGRPCSRTRDQVIALYYHFIIQITSTNTHTKLSCFKSIWCANEIPFAGFDSHFVIIIIISHPFGFVHASVISVR